MYVRKLSPIVLIVLVIILSSCVVQPNQSQGGGTPPTEEPPEIVWQKVIGGSGNEVANFIEKTSDGGFIVAGFTKSEDIEGYHGDGDVLIVKLSEEGEVEWQKVFGGSEEDNAASIRQTEDGGYIVIGASKSEDGDVSENHGDQDMWILKLDAEGNILWSKVLGGYDDDFGMRIEQTEDGGYIIAARTYSDSVCSEYHGWRDIWVVKIDGSGEVQWQKCLGGSDKDLINDMIKAHDGGYIIVGQTLSDDGDVNGEEYHGGGDVWIVKLSDEGEIEWQRLLGGSGDDFGTAIERTSDGGYIVVGGTSSNDGNVGENKGMSDAWVVKLDGSGNILWKKVLGGSRNDMAVSVIQTSDGGYVVSGITSSYDGDFEDNHSYYNDVWVAKFDGSGNLIWIKCFGGSYNEGSYSNLTAFVQESNDGGYVIATYTRSIDGDLEGLRENYDKDIWVFKIR